MDRPSIRRGMAVAPILALAVLPILGCQSLLLTAVYLFKGRDIDPEFADLKGKKVVVVCRPSVSLQYSNSNVGRDLAREVTQLLQTNVPKIQTVNSRKVAKWVDENTWDEYREVGKAMKADMVIGIDLEQFNLRPGQCFTKARPASRFRSTTVQRPRRETTRSSSGIWPK